MTITSSQISQASKVIFAAGIIYGGTLFGFRKYLNEAGNIISEISKLIKGSELVASLLCHIGTITIASFIFIGLWGLGFYSFYALFLSQGRSYNDFTTFSAIWLSVLVLFNLIFYYACVFVNTFVLMRLIRGKRDLKIARSYWILIRYHLGTIMLASVLALFTNILNTVFVLSSMRNSDNKILAYLANLTKYALCLFKGALEVYVKVINSNAVSTSAITG